MRLFLVLAPLSLLFFPSCSSNRLFYSKNAQEVNSRITKFLKSHSESNEDPAEYDSLWQNTLSTCPKVSSPNWIIPSPYLPKDIKIRHSNNNVTIAAFNHRLFVAFRTSPTHFASKKTALYIMSSDNGSDWKKELEILSGRDEREPFLIAMGDTLHFYFFAAGKSMTSFSPENIQHYNRDRNGKWYGPDKVLNKGEVHWSIKNRNGKTYLSSYEGSHYKLKGDSEVSLLFKTTMDGKTFNPVGDSALVYYGGVSETDFEFDRKGNLWAVTRLEDGDKTGFGSHVVYASKDSLDKWEFPTKADPNCYMSPKVFRQGDEIYLVARKQLGRKPFGKTKRNKPMSRQRLNNWIGYSITPKSTALYRINQSTRTVEWLMDLPGAGDTAFPSLMRLDENHLLLANYSSPLKFNKRSWISGQFGKTGIYLCLISFDVCK